MAPYKLMSVKHNYSAHNISPEILLSHTYSVLLFTLSKDANKYQINNGNLKLTSTDQNNEIYNPKLIQVQLVLISN